MLPLLTNNVGALEPMLPVALQSASAAQIRAPHAFMPLALGSMLGGLATMIGTPPNIIISTHRAAVLDSYLGSGGDFGDNWRLVLPLTS